MANRELIVVRKPRPEIYAIAGVTGLVGLYLLLQGAKGGGKSDALGAWDPLGSNHSLSNLRSLSLDAPGSITVPIGQNIIAADPKVTYAGPGMDTYSYCRIVQQRSGQWVTVQGSGVAGVHIGPPNGPSTAAEYELADEPVVPCGDHNDLCAIVYPGPDATPISGAPPLPGAAMAVLEIYACSHPVGDPQHPLCFASPTQPPGRRPVLRRLYPNKINYV